MTRPSLSRVVFAAALALSAGAVPFVTAWAQGGELAPFVANEQTDLDLSQLDEQNVTPARRQLLGAMQQLRADRQAGDQDTIFRAEIAVIEARQAVINAQIVSDQTRMAQAPADVQAMLQARDLVLQTELTLGEAQKKLIADSQANNTGALREDVALVNSAQVQSQSAHQQWRQVRAQIHSEINPAGIQ